MYGRDYLDWRDKTRVAGEIDDFLSAMPAEDRKWALAVLRERHTVYEESPLGQLAPGRFVPMPNYPIGSSRAILQAQLEAQRQAVSQHSAAGLFGNIFGL